MKMKKIGTFFAAIAYLFFAFLGVQAATGVPKILSYQGRLFAVFSTVDKQTGVDHYEVAEVPTADLGLSEGEWKWTRAVSPYLIKDQNLDGVIKVWAIDKAGNERIEEYSAQKLPPTRDWRFAVIPYVAIIGLTGFVLVRIILSLLF